MRTMDSRDELAEFDLTEDEFEEMLAAGEPVKVVGPPDVERRSRFEVFRESTNQYGWRLTASDGQVLAADTTYPDKAAARTAAEAVMRAAVGAPLVDRTAG